ncbi:hypothetical protein POM88_037862 [Heracleum sosnowskyi]|uniref:Uncharacterized protein n=1 Tax=Heracleum sosnowskyi TaxID=360622 RepID=A0AAD8HTF9_9APIA|nr:hypothetical protein POM88_037862 [Heracleum sosnowskyi]
MVPGWSKVPRTIACLTLYSEWLKRLLDAPELRIEDRRSSWHWKGRHKRLKRLIDDKRTESSEEGPKLGCDPHSINLAFYVAAKKRSLLRKRNHRGDAALHMAVLGGQPRSPMCS